MNFSRLNRISQALLLMACVGATVGALVFSDRAAAQLTGSLGVHDPSRIMKVDNRYYLFATGNNISTKWSTNLTQWNNGSSVFSAPPAWTQAAVPGFNRNFWAPDVVFVNGKYHLYYSVSTFGSQVSAIGLATNPTLNPAAPDFQWTDQGVVLQSQNGSPFNAIDPGIFHNDDGRMWMTFGSFWTGIYTLELNPLTGKRIAPQSTITRLAHNVPSTQIEAPFLYKHDGSYYLFVNWGTCCQGTNSTYNVRVGRSSSPTGPFVDKNGVNMVSGGGSLFLAAEDKFLGPGHMGIFAENGAEYFTYHYYDRDDSGRSKLNMRRLGWAIDGWPIIVNVPEPCAIMLIAGGVALIACGFRRSVARGASK